MKFIFVLFWIIDFIYCECNNINPINSLVNNECDENENKSDKIKINVEEEKILIIIIKKKIILIILVIKK